MYIGAAYYPELWEENEIEKDIERCKRIGVNCLRVGEFAWGKMEPREGVFNFDWLYSIVDRLHAEGIKTVMCTPTCTPPRWFLNKYPETREVSSDGVRRDVSSRCHPCKTSLLMRRKNREIVTEMAKVFGKHPGVIGWQIDNELFVYNNGCYCELCKNAFRTYLKTKYGRIEDMNRKWGMARWSLDYSDFDEIEPPTPDQWRHPSLRTEWRLFQCEQIYSYIHEQAEILHRYTDTPIGTDMMPNNTLSYYRANEHLDVVQFNHYDTAERLPLLAFDYNFLRPIKKHPFWVTETQVGWNGSEFSENGYRPVGNCYANTWMPIAMGAEMNLYWLFRTHHAGHELAHGALFSTCGREYRVSEEVKRAAEEIERCKPFLENSVIKSRIAIHYSSAAEHNYSSAPIVKNFSYRGNLIHKIHDAFRHYNVDLIDTQHGLEGYDTLISPYLTTIDDSTKEKIEQWIREGGTWIVGPMSDTMTDYSAKPTHAPFFFLEELAGVYTKYQKPIPNEVFRARWSNGEPLEISGYYDAFEATNSQSLATYDGDEFDGYSVITERAVGKGRVIMVGSMLSHGALRQLVGKTPIANASENVRLVERSGKRCGMIAMELENKEGYVTLKEDYTDLISGRPLTGKILLKPYEVLVLEHVN